MNSSPNPGAVGIAPPSVTDHRRSQIHAACVGSRHNPDDVGIVRWGPVDPRVGRHSRPTLGFGTERLRRWKRASLIRLIWMRFCIVFLVVMNLSSAAASNHAVQEQPAPPETQPAPPEPPPFPPETQPVPPEPRPLPPESQPAPPETQPAPPESQPAPPETPPAPPESQPAPPETQPSNPETQPGRARGSAPASDPTTTSSTSTGTTTSQKTEEKESYLAIVNGIVHTVTGPTLLRATVLCKNDKIIAVGDDLRLPLECTVIDAAGMHVYPGLVAASSGGIHGGTPVEDNTDLFGLNMEIALAAGITTAIAGNDVAKLTFGTTDGMIVRRNVYVDLASGWRTPIARAELRRDLEKVRSYRRDLQRYEVQKANEDKDAKEPDKESIKGKFEQYLKLMKGEAVAVISADEQPALVALAGLAREFGFRLIVRGAREAWTVAGVLARADMGVVITPRNTTEADERYNRLTGSSVESARILMDHGVDVAVVPPLSTIVTFGIAGRDLLQLNMEAAFAVRGGLSNAEAIRTITIDAARILGVGERVGSIEVGKDADLIVTDGELLHYMTLVQQTVVNGKSVYEKSKSSLFAHIRPTTTQRAAVPEFDDVWPRRLAWPEDLAGSKPASQPAAWRPPSSPVSQPVTTRPG